MANGIRRQQIANRNLVNEVPSSRFIVASENGFDKTDDNFYVTLGETITAGEPIYVTNGLAYLADSQPCIAIALEGGDSDDLILAQCKGFYQFDGVAGADLWNVAGKLTNKVNYDLFWQKLGTMTYQGTCLLNIESGVWNA